MKVYGLYGKSGTGKSYQAMNLCRELNIESIIDDGLFISQNRVLAGISAKRQPSKIKAIKTALYTDEAHRDEVMQKIAEVDPESLLILGTSDDMVMRITARLELPKPYRMIPIEDITTEEERETARKQRKEFGKHVIPAPTFQIKRQFSGYFLDPLKMLRGLGGKTAYTEKTVVRPTYSYLGDYKLSDKVIADIVAHVAAKIDGVVAVLHVLNEAVSDGVKIDVLVLMKYGAVLIETARELQAQVEKEVEAMTAFNIVAVNIQIKGLK